MSLRPAWATLWDPISVKPQGIKTIIITTTTINGDDGRDFEAYFSFYVLSHTDIWSRKCTHALRYSRYLPPEENDGGMWGGGGVSTHRFL